MMKLVSAFLFVTLLSTALGAPAVVWKKSSSNEPQRFLHSSEALSASDLMKNVVVVKEHQASEAPSALSTVVFLVGKGEDGSEQLSELASSGKLPQTFQKYPEATDIYHHVSGIESTSTMVQEATRATSPNNNNRGRVMEVSLNELTNKLSSPTLEVEIDNQGGTASASSTPPKKGKRARDLAKADVYIVSVNAAQQQRDASVLDAAIVSAIESTHVDSVVLSGIRSIHEVKHSRYLASKRRMSIMEEQGNKVVDSVSSRNSNRRRLEQEGNDDAANDNGNDDMAGVYYVFMTPNILAGLLFTLLFLVIACTGISCMSNIQGQDTFTDKMPSVGREA